MGLFIGASILTILELFDYIYEVRPSPFTLFLWQDVGWSQTKTLQCAHMDY